jgi:RNA polymerase sigma-70 factor (ECF subfamily)
VRETYKIERARNKGTFILFLRLTFTRRQGMASDHDHHKFAEVVDAHYESIFRGAISVARDKHIAEEIVQETFVSAFKKFDSYSGRSSVFTWLYGIMLNKYRDYCRKRRLLKRLGFMRGETSLSGTTNASSRDPSPHAELANSEECALLMGAVDRLPVKLRVVVAMRYFDGLPLNEIASILTCSLGTVKSRLSRAKERLSDLLRKELV